MKVDSYIIGSILIVGISLLSVLGLLVVRKYFDLEKLKSCHEVGGYLLSVVGTMYAVLLGLIVVDAMTKFQTAREVVEQEANSLADVFLLSESFPPEKCRTVRIVCNNYVKEILTEEWPAMANGKISKTPTGESRQDSRKVVDGPTTVRFAAMIGPDGKTKKTRAEEMKPDVNRHVPNKLTNSVARRIWNLSETQGWPSKGVAKKLRDR